MVSYQIQTIGQLCSLLEAEIAHMHLRDSTVQMKSSQRENLMTYEMFAALYYPKLSHPHLCVTGNYIYYIGELFLTTCFQIRHYCLENF